MRILIINSGSSSIKFALYHMPQERWLLSGTLQRIGKVNSSRIFREHAASGQLKKHKESAPIADYTAGVLQTVASGYWCSLQTRNLKLPAKLLPRSTKPQAAYGLD